MNLKKPMIRKLPIVIILLISTFSVLPQERATAQTGDRGVSPAPPSLPEGGTLRSGKILRNDSGKIVLKPAAPTAPDPAAEREPQARNAPDGAEQENPPSVATGSEAVPLTAARTEPAAGAAAPSLPPQSTLKPGVVQRSDTGNLSVGPREAQDLRVCKPDRAQSHCGFLSLADAVDAAQPGDTIVLGPGVYPDAALVKVPRLTIRGEPGAHLRGGTVEGKAALVVRADDVVIEGIECSEIRVPDRNGACVRVEGHDLTLRNIYAHNNEEGVLGGVGGTVLIEDSVFEQNGANRGYAHGVYISRSVETFIFRRNKVLATKDEGQGVKSRAQKTIIEDNVIAGLDSRDSRALDIPNGGDIVVRRNILQKGPNSANQQMIGLGLEGKLHPKSRAIIENNIIVFDGALPDWMKVINDRVPFASPSGTAVYSRMPDVVLKDNVVVGIPRVFEGEGVTESDTTLYPTRARAGLPAYPQLPSPPAPSVGGSN